MIGIYRITNTVNGKVYIGQSKDVEERLKSHRSDSTSRHLKYSIKHYGVDKFLFEVIEEVPVEKLNERERYWIAFYQSTDPSKGYNLTTGGERDAGWHHSDEVKARLSLEGKARAHLPGYVNPATGTTIIHKGDQTSRCKLVDLEKRLSQGWELGASEKTLKEAASKRLGPKNGAYGKGYLTSGPRNGFYGRHHTEETKAKIRASMPDTSAAWRGRHDTEESKQKMRGPRASLAGENNPNYGRRGSASQNWGKRGINNGIIGKRVPAEEVPTYLAQGWKLGYLRTPKESRKDDT